MRIRIVLPEIEGDYPADIKRRNDAMATVIARTLGLNTFKIQFDGDTGNEIWGCMFFKDDKKEYPLWEWLAE